MTPLDIAVFVAVVALVMYAGELRETRRLNREIKPFDHDGDGRLGGSRPQQDRKPA